MKWKLVFIFTVLSSQVLAQDSSRLHDELLKKHLKFGQLNSHELKEQRYQLQKSKPFQRTFNNAVRGVASKIQDNRKVLNITNPAIEISAK
jgi:hypothetical protein